MLSENNSGEGERRVAQVRTLGADDDTYYYHTDHLQSASIMTAGSDVEGNLPGDKVEDLYYYPYGEVLSDFGSISVKHKFAGHEYDAETGLIYMGARYYDPKLARFISADTIVPMPFYPQSLNRYSYTLNNPIILRELDGHCYSGMPSGYTPPSPNPTPAPSQGGASTGAITTASNNATNSQHTDTGNSILTTLGNYINAGVTFFMGLFSSKGDGTASANMYASLGGGGSYMYDFKVDPKDFDSLAGNGLVLSQSKWVN